MLPDVTKKITDKVKKTIEEQGLISPNEHIVIGLSGGPDSMCLFHVLLNLQKEWGLTIHPVHVNHKFRPGAAERDQAFVENLCKAHGLTCHTFVVDCNALAEQMHMTSEEAGRKARYDAFCQVAERVAKRVMECAKQDDGEENWTSEVPRRAEACANVKIAVAQNANDQAETILFRLLRGTGTDGLAGIAYQRQEQGFQVIRPLLDIYRAEIEEYCSFNKLTPVIDQTNNESIYARNKIRLELIPHLEKEYNENILEGLVRLAGIAAKDKDYLWQQTEAEYRRLTQQMERGYEDAGAENLLTPSEIIMDRQQLADLHEAIRHRVILKAFGEIGLEKDISEERIKAADAIISKKQGRKTVQFPHGYAITVEKGRVKFYRAAANG